MGIQQGLVNGPHIVSKEDIKTLSARGKAVASVRMLQNNGFACCVNERENRPCIYAQDVHPGLDPSAATLGCRKHRRNILIDEACACHDQQ